ncbi:hypothetical protein [Variovorax sp. UMC13]|uniref:hypothetical protein n=1 Tax=Variovorax sp. UMC13 TaxID=1862326 RepID=UPI0016024474|nr:hypothetical protein [Variovorax sp. UMC13]MBB1601273.1 hypothetical protein [Variovorax sp. UMC13]
MSMSHVQQQILDELEAVLKAAATDAGLHVFLDRADPLRPDLLPALLIAEAPQGEEIDAQTVRGLEQRIYSVLITCVVADEGDSARLARELGRQVETALTSRTAQLPKAGRAQIAAARMTSDSDGDCNMAQREQLWRFTYSTRRGAPGDPL